MLYEQAATIATEVLGPNSTEHALALRNLANLGYVQGKYSEAEELYRRVLEMMEQELGPAHEDLVEVLTWLAETRFKNQQYDEAEEPCQRSVAILEQEGELALEQLANVCMRLAHLYYFVGRYQEAEPQYLRALTTREQVLGTGSPGCCPQRRAIGPHVPSESGVQRIVGKVPLERLVARSSGCLVVLLKTVEKPLKRLREVRISHRAEAWCE